jgi:hypothetical protein
MRITFFMTLAAVAAVGCDSPQAAGRDALAAPVSAARGATASSEAPRTADPAPATTTRAKEADAREVTIPAGTQLSVRLDTPVGSDTSRVEQAVTAHLTRAVVVRGETVLLEGTRVSGTVTDATRSAKVKGRAHVAMRFDGLTPRGDDQRYAIRTALVGRTAASTKQKDALEIGAPAAGGAIIGALMGGKKGALVGTAVGGGAGTAVVLSTRGKEVHLAKGAPLMLKLAAPLTIKVRS